MTPQVKLDNPLVLTIDNPAQIVILEDALRMVFNSTKDDDEMKILAETVKPLLAAVTQFTQNYRCSDPDCEFCRSHPVPEYTEPQGEFDWSGFVKPKLPN